MGVGNQQPDHPVILQVIQHPPEGMWAEYQHPDHLVIQQLPEGIGAGNKQPDHPFIQPPIASKVQSLIISVSDFHH
ncbi:hypothetical protein FCV25MIE_03497 [Fagus crenata]